MKETIIGAIIGAVITGIFSLLIHYVTEKQKKKFESAKVRQDIHSNRPELAIVGFKDYLSRVGYGIKKKCDIELFVAGIDKISLEKDVYAIYRDKDFKENEWCCVIYTLKNVGKTDISVLNVVSTYKKDTCVFPCERAKQYADGGALTYSWCYDEKIRSGESVTLKLCYHRDRIIMGLMSAIMVLGLQDSNGRYWQQPFFAPDNKLYDSIRVSASEYYRDLRNEDAIECFKNPYLW